MPPESLETRVDTREHNFSELQILVTTRLNAHSAEMRELKLAIKTLDSKINTLDARLNGLDAKLDTQIAKMDADFAEMRAKLNALPRIVAEVIAEQRRS